MFDTNSTKRLHLLARIAFLWIFVVLIRLVHLQVWSHDDFQRQAQSQQQKTIEIQVPRGTIYDRANLPLAMSLPVDSVCVNPLRIPDLEVAASILGRVLKIDEGELLYKMKLAVDNQKGFLWIKRKIEPDESTRLRSLNLDWIEFRSESKRFYPSNSLAAHVVGSVDHDEKGNSGLELSQNESLQGRPGEMQMFRDVKQHAFDAQIESEAEMGENITLSIDSRIQSVAERELKIAVEKAQCKTGSVVAMNPKTGEILAMANYPTFDPNEPPTRGSATAGRTNLAVSTPFEPGSVFKVITLSAALETTHLRPESVIPCGNGSFKLFGRVIHDTHSYGALTMADVLAKSSNIGAIQIGLKVGDERLYDYVRRFGFGQRSGVPLPGESVGLLRKLRQWQKTSIGSVAMGHEVMATAVQLAQACSVVANGGTRITPRLILRRQRPGEAATVEPMGRSERIIKPETAITMRQMMEGVVLHGTGKGARLKGYTSAGKTGSAQIFDFATKQYTHHYNGSFMGFAPITNPAVVIVVTLNGTSGGSAGYGGVVSAPVFREVMTAALRILDVPKDLPENDKTPRVDDSADMNDLSIAELSNPPESADEGSSTAVSSLAQNGGESPGPDQRAFLIGPKTPDFQGKTIRAVLEQSSESGVAVEIMGSGLARVQEPPAGSALPPGRKVRVRFAR